MAGLGSACSHVAALLFKLETAVHLELNKPSAPTSQLCAWKKCKRNVTPAPIKAINFQRAKKHQLPNDLSLVPKNSITKSYSFRNPNCGINGLNSEEIKSLYKANPKAAFFTSIDINDFEPNELFEDSETDTASETEENCIPDTLTSLYDPSSINLSKTELHNLCEDRYKEYVDSYTQTNYDNLTEITKKQNLSKI